MLVFNSNFKGNSVFRCGFKNEVYNVDNHIHQFSEIFYVRRGTVDLHLPSHCETIHPGQIAVIAPYQVHAYVSTEKSSLWLCLFDNAMLQDLLPLEEVYSERQRSIFTPSPSLAAYLAGHFVDTEDKLVPYEPALYRRMKSLLAAIYDEFVEQVPIETNKQEDSVLPSLLLYTGEHLNEPINLASASKALGYSRSSLSHSLTRYGTSFRELINSIRIDYAKTRLKTTDKRIIEIAHDCGFNSETTFHRVFLDVTGSTPGQYRKNGSLSPTLNFYQHKLNEKIDEYKNEDL